MTGRPREREPGTKASDLRGRTAYPQTNKMSEGPDADRAYYESNRSGKKGKPGLLRHLKEKLHGDLPSDSDVEYERGHREVDSGGKFTRKKDHEYASGRHREDPDYIDPEVQGPPPEAEEAKCAKRNCDVIIYIDPETEKPYDPQPRRRPEICDHCGRPWPEGKPYSERIRRVIEERLANSRYRNLNVLCKDHECIDHGVQVDERDLDGNGLKRALLIGIYYRDQENERRGYKTDVYQMKKYLQSNDYREEDIDILMEKWDKYRHPTRDEIIRHMETLVKDAKDGDSLFFYYSGHDDQTIGERGDERNRKEEGIYPVDYKISDPKGILNYDDMHNILTDVPKGVHLTALFDSCRSGSVLNLPYALINKKVEMVNPDQQKDPKKYGRVVLWNGRKNTKTSADRNIKGRDVGSMSYAFIRANEELSEEKEERNYTYDELLVRIRRVLRKKYQVPQLSSTQPFDPQNHTVYI